MNNKSLSFCCDTAAVAKTKKSIRLWLKESQTSLHNYNGN